jgi:biotin transporter BioY
VVTGSSFDSGGFLVAFVACAVMTAIMAVRYWRNRHGRERSEYMIRLTGVAFLALLTGLRRFVLHQ